MLSNKRWRLTLLVAVLLLGSNVAKSGPTEDGTAAESRVESPTPVILKAGTVFASEALCFTPAAIDVMTLDREALEDEIDAAESRIRTLEADLAVAQWDITIAKKEGQLAGLDTEIARLQRGGFLRRHLRLCGQLGMGAVLMGSEQGEVYPVVSVGLCVLP